MNFLFRAATGAAISMTAVAAIASTVSADAVELSAPAAMSASTSVQAVEAKSADKNIVFTSAEVVQTLPTPNAGTKAEKTTKAVDSIIRGSRKGNLSDTVGTFRGNMGLSGEERCLAGAVYFESKGEPLEGQMAVAHVILNRVSSGRFAGSICGVVYQKSQFSFVRGGRMPSIPEGSEQWKTAVAVAKTALADAWDSPVGGAMYFHATYVSPGWNRARVRTIGNHIFYR